VSLLTRRSTGSGLIDIGDALEFPACHDKMFRLGEKGARVSGLSTLRQHSCTTLVDIPDVGRTIFKVRFCVKFRLKLRVVVHGW
jgi:hypothetical protein